MMSQLNWSHTHNTKWERYAKMDEISNHSNIDDLWKFLSIFGFDYAWGMDGF